MVKWVLCTIDLIWTPDLICILATCTLHASALYVPYMMHGYVKVEMLNSWLLFIHAAHLKTVSVFGSANELC